MDRKSKCTPALPSQGHAGAALEWIVGRLSLVPSVSAASWQIDSHNSETGRPAET